jgi:hypothetical protein
MVHLIHVVSDVSMEAGAMPVWLGAYDSPQGPPATSSYDAHAVRSYPTHSSPPHHTVYDRYPILVYPE